MAAEKEVIRALSHPISWVGPLPIILFTLRATEKDIHYTPVERGKFAPAGSKSLHFLAFLPGLQQAMASLQHTPLQCSMTQKLNFFINQLNTNFETTPLL